MPDSKPKFLNRYAELLEIKIRREARHITQQEVAEATGVSERTLSDYGLNKVAMYRSTTLAALCAYFDCTIDEFLILEDEDGEGYSEKEVDPLALIPA